MQRSRRSRWSVPTPQDWDVVAVDVASRLKEGDILALQGPLGAGKTTFVQALARVMGTKTIPKSPTFSLLRTYAVRYGNIQRLLHVDAYRIEDERDFRPLDLEAELAELGTVLLLEWPENVAAWLRRKRVVTLKIQIQKKGRRVLSR